MPAYRPCSYQRFMAWRWPLGDRVFVPLTRYRRWPAEQRLQRLSPPGKSWISGLEASALKAVALGDRQRR